MITEYSPNMAEVEVKYKSKVKASDRPHILTSKDSEKILREIWDKDKIEMQEEFVLLLLNRNNKLLGWVKISSGGVNGTLCDAKIVFSIALKCLASGIILSHNHPSGSKSPSDADKVLTKNIKEAGRILDISVLDHIILTTEGYLSFSDEGLM